MMQSFSVVPIKQIQIIADGSLSVSSYFPSRERELLMIRNGHSPERLCVVHWRKIKRVKLLIRFLCCFFQ